MRSRLWFIEAHRSVQSVICSFYRKYPTKSNTIFGEVSRSAAKVRINAEQIAYDIRNLNRSPEQRLLASLELLELDEYEVEPLAVHWEALCALGIAFQSERVQLTINSYMRNLEGAILYTLDVGNRLRFDSPEHATNTFVRALREGWKPGR